MSGQLIKSQKTNNYSSITINTEHIQCGIYQLTMSNEYAFLCQKIIIN